MVAITLAPFYTLLLIPHLGIFPPLFIMDILVLFKHKNNITRLIDGVEPKINLKTNVIEEVVEPPYNTSGKETAEPMVEEIPLLETKTPIKEIKLVNINPAETTKQPIKKSKGAKTTKAKTDKSVATENTVKKPTKKPVKKTAKPKNKTPSDKSKE